MPIPQIHFLGEGAVPQALAYMALDDQIEAFRFEGAEIHFWAAAGAEPPQTLLDLHAYQEENYAGITPVWHFPMESRCFSEEFGHMVKESDPAYVKVLVLWDESATTREVVETALASHIEVYDLSDALTRIGSLASQDTYNKESIMPTTAKYTEDILAEMDEAEITAVAEAFGIDHAAYPTWDPVIAAILAAQEDDPGAEPQGVEEAEEEGGGYTRQELELLELETLKEICRVNGIEVPGQRPRAARYIDAILEAQSGTDKVEEAVAEHSAQVEPIEAPQDSEESFSGDSVVVALITVAIEEAVEEAFSQTAEMLRALGASIGVQFGEFNRRLDAIQTSLERPEPTPTPQSLAAAMHKVGAVPAKAMQPVRKLARPYKFT